MTNADKFKNIFGLYATELWAMPEKNFLEWLNVECEPSAQPEPQWIPVKYRPMDEEERGYWSEHLGYDIEDDDAVMLNCRMPEDGQEILVSYRKWVCMDICEVDGCIYGLEGNGDWDGVIAWKPLPEPYQER